MTRRICLVTPGNLAANPRIVKEADALQEAGYDVTAVVSDYSAALRPFDETIIAKARWRVVRAPHAPSDRYVSAAARVAAKLIDGVGAAISPTIAAYASRGPIGALTAAASSVRADLYIAHYVAALPAAGEAAQRHGARLGFDAEDFHPGEGDAQLTKLVRAVEGEWLPRCRHLTAAAPLIAKAYASAYGVPLPATVLNVFPLEMAPTEVSVPRPPGAPIRAYWFSQTIGLDRGLQPFLQAMAQARTRIELELRGADPWGHAGTLLAQARDLGLADRVRVLPLGAPDEMVRLAAAYDLGLSLETDVSQNRQLCLTNKIFTYLLAGVPVLMSETPAQRQLAPDLGAAAAVAPLSDPKALATAIDRLADGLDAAKVQAARLGRERYNWETEKAALLASVDAALARQGEGRR
jgi:glycosyltransferase involved in cell wall biosynthesis